MSGIGGIGGIGSIGSVANPGTGGSYQIDKTAGKLSLGLFGKDTPKDSKTPKPKAKKG